MKFIPLILLFLLTSSCGFSVKPPEPLGQYPATVQVVAKGLKEYTLIPDEVAWFSIHISSLSSQTDPVAKERMTPDNPLKNYRLDSDKEYTFAFRGVSPVFGGVKTCNVSLNVKLKKSQRVRIIFEKKSGFCKVRAERM